MNCDDPLVLFSVLYGVWDLVSGPHAGRADLYSDGRTISPPLSGTGLKALTPTVHQRKTRKCIAARVRLSRG